MKKRFKYLSCLLAFLFSLILCFLLRGEHPIASDATQIQATGNRLQSRCPGAADTFKGSQQSDVYRTIIDNNLFRPLGWQPSRPREKFIACWEHSLPGMSKPEYKQYSKARQREQHTSSVSVIHLTQTPLSPISSRSA